MMTLERIKQMRELFPVNEGETYHADHPTVIINELLDEKNIEWVIVGGESGAKLRKK
jgi:protein gp37